MEDTCGIRVQKNKNHLQLRELNRLRPIQSTHWGSRQKWGLESSKEALTQTALHEWSQLPISSSWIKIYFQC